VRLHSSLNNKV